MRLQKPASFKSSSAGMFSHVIRHAQLVLLYCKPRLFTLSLAGAGVLFHLREQMLAGAGILHCTSYLLSTPGFAAGASHSRPFPCCIGPWSVLRAIRLWMVSFVEAHLFLQDLETVRVS